MPRLISNNPHPARVLCFSRDPNLLHTRAMVLGTRFDAVCVTSLAEIEELSRTRVFELLLLCHTLLPDDCRRACNLVRSTSPQARVISMASDHASCAAQADLVVISLDGPAVLLHHLEQLAASDTKHPIRHLSQQAAAE